MSMGLRFAGLALMAGLGGSCADAFKASITTVAQIEEEAADPPEVAIGERLFLETRFAQFFFAHSNGNPNATLTAGDPVMDTLKTPLTGVPSPFKGQSMNCRQCHLVDEAAMTAGFRTYGDFATRSPIPDRGDGGKTTPRNSPPMMNLVLNASEGEIYHFDGEFPDLEHLVKGSFTGRNFGWLATEQAKARKHIAAIIRGDNGSGKLAQEFGGAYKDIFTGNSVIKLPPAYRLDVKTASDEEILDAIARLVAAYVDSLVFAQDKAGNFTGSPYDAFLAKNNLPRQPESDESDLVYSQRLRAALAQLSKPAFITPKDGAFTLSKQPYVFGPQELAGLKVFLAEPQGNQLTFREKQKGGIGNCLTCHAAPKFTDFGLHNTGVSQEEYDALHGAGTFSRLPVPNLKRRNENYNAYLPATAIHPKARGVFRKPAQLDQPLYSDLGAWNSYRNPDFATPPEKIEQAMGLTDDFRPNRILAQSLGRFKTPGLRDLGDSAPYFHNGSKRTLEAVLRFYQTTATQARKSQLRNGDPHLSRISLKDQDIIALSAFLQALKEDYN